jgi:transcription initiation factor IIE alpha subunit
MQKKIKYQFVYDENGRFLICPECHMKITSSDVEMFPACPYCGRVLERTPEFDDFAIDNLVHHWQHNCFGIVKGH